jgi:hypothetical protein
MIFSVSILAYKKKFFEHCIFSIFFTSGISLTILGIIGLYMGRIHSQVKQRPLYIVESRLGFKDSSGE